MLNADIKYNKLSYFYKKGGSFLSRSTEIGGKKFLGINLLLCESFSGLQLWNKPNKQVCDFLSATDINERRIFAEDLINHYWDLYGKQNYGEYIKKLIDIETGITKFNKSHRDHITHSAYVFLLGIYLYLSDESIKESIQNKCDELPLEGSNEKKFIFMWNIISTFHDIGYPFDSFSKEMNLYMNMINESGQNIDGYKENSFKIEFSNIAELSDGENSFHVMNEQQKSNNVNRKYLNLEDYFKYKNCKGKIDHGILSSIILLKITDILYQEQDWSRDLFKRVFPEIGLAIALHNIKWKDLNGYCGDNNILKEDLPEITLKDFPFCYLLILADTLQEWDRPSLAKPVLPSTGVSIDYNENDEKFEVKFALSDERVEEIKEELNDKISISDGKQLPSINVAL